MANITSRKLRSQHKKRALAKNILDNLPHGGTVKDAALKTGYHPEHAYRLVKTDDEVRAILFGAMEDVGITSPLVAAKMYEGMNAMTPPKKEGGQRYEDYFVRKQYLDMYFRLQGMYAPEKHEINEKRIVIVMTPEVVNGLKDARAIDGEVIDVEEIDGTKEVMDARVIHLDDQDMEITDNV